MGADEVQFEVGRKVHLRDDGQTTIVGLVRGFLSDSSCIILWIYTNYCVSCRLDSSVVVVVAHPAVEIAPTLDCL